MVEKDIDIAWRKAIYTYYGMERRKDVTASTEAEALLNSRHCKTRKRLVRAEGAYTYIGRRAPKVVVLIAKVGGGRLLDTGV